MNDAQRKYQNHKSKAKQRGIEFDLTFDEWMEIWGEKLQRIGTSSDSYGMLRLRDEGGYSVGNVRIGSPKENACDRSLALKVRSAQSPAHPNSQHLKKPLGIISWVANRNRVFDEYIEEEDE